MSRNTVLVLESAARGAARAARAALACAAVIVLAAGAASAASIASIAPVHAAAAVLEDPPKGQGKPQASKGDQLSVRSKRDGSLQLLAGSISANNLDQVVVLVAGKETKLDSELVVRITWGDVPPSYKDGRIYFNRGQYADAAAQFRLAAGDASARDVVKAAARLWAAQALLSWGASDPLHFGEASEEAGKFLASHPTNRDVPEARALQARAKWMAGQTAEAAQLYKALYAEWKPEGATPGYRRELCLSAGLSAARALCQVQPPDTLAARELYSSLEKAAGDALAALEPNAPARTELARLQAEGSLGPGFSELAGANVTQAMAFFRSKLGAQGGSDALRYGASFGLAQALLQLGKLREAQIEFARVSALEHSDRDRAAAAQVGLADATLKLADPDAVPQARKWLDAVVASYGDTLAASRAREMLKKL